MDWFSSPFASSTLLYESGIYWEITTNFELWIVDWKPRKCRHKIWLVFNNFDVFLHCESIIGIGNIQNVLKSLILKIPIPENCDKKSIHRKFAISNDFYGNFCWFFLAFVRNYFEQRFYDREYFWMEVVGYLIFIHFRLKLPWLVCLLVDNCHFLSYIHRSQRLVMRKRRINLFLWEILSINDAWIHAWDVFWIQVKIKILNFSFLNSWFLIHNS